MHITDRLILHLKQIKIPFKGMNGGHGESLGIRNRKKLIWDLFKNSSSKEAIWEIIFCVKPTVSGTKSSRNFADFCG